MDDADRGLDIERLDPFRTALLGICTTLLAIAFFGLLIVDQASAVTF